MASKVNILNCRPTPKKLSVTDKWSVEVSIEVLDDCVKELTWALIFVGSPKDKAFDQQLASAVIGPLGRDKYDFVIEGSAPNNDLIPQQDILGMSILFLIGSFKDQEFIRIGFYVSTFYNQIELNECPPDIPLLDRIERQIINTTPRITKFTINWHHNEDSMVDMSMNNMVDFGDDLWDQVETIT